MLKIYSIPMSLYCAKLRILLGHKGLDWQETRPPGGYGSDEFKTYVPSGNLPSLVHGDVVIGDSEAIAEYLEEVYPDPSMLPGTAADRARIRDRGRFSDTRLEPALRVLFPYLPGRKVLQDDMRGPAVDGLNARLQQLAQMLRTEDGTVLTLGDCGLIATFAWIDGMAPRMGLNVKWPDAVTAYRTRLAGHAAVADELATYVPIVDDFLTV